MSFGFAFNTSCIRGAGLDVEEEVTLVADAGYDGIELWVRELDAYLDSGRSLAALKRLLKERGLQVSNLIAFFNWASPDEAARKEGFAQARRVFAMARELGCPYVAAPPFGVTDRTDIPAEDFAARFHALMELGREMGTMPLLEFWRHSQALGSLREALDVLALLPPEAVMLADVFHMAKVEGSYALLREVPGKRIGLFHVNDFPAHPPVAEQKDSDRVYPGDGVAPLGQIARTLRSIGFSGMLSLELFNADYVRNGAQSVVRTGLAKMREAFG